jgi:hypothetical protein
MCLLQRVVGVVLKGILPGLLNRNNIGANNFFFSQELRHHYVLRSVHIILIYLKLAAHPFPRYILLAVVMIH